MKIDAWEQLTDQIAEAAFAKVSRLIDAHVDKTIRADIKLTFSESEAAEQLGVSVSTLAAWRRARLITVAVYPQAKKDALSDMYSYSPADLLNFRERYLIKAPNEKNVFEISKAIKFSGVELKEAA